MRTAPIKVRIGIPETTGQIPLAVRRLGAAAMVSAGALWQPDRGEFKAPGVSCFHLDKALDSSGFVRGKQGAYPWTVEQYVRIYLADQWAWWSQMDLPCEEALAPDRAAVIGRIERSAELYAECRAALVRLRAQMDPDIAHCYVEPVPVLQGRELPDYLLSARLLAERCGGELPGFVGVGSMCTREIGGAAGLVAIVRGLDLALPSHVQLHIFGAKGGAAKALSQFERVREIDSMAWDFRARQLALERFRAMSQAEQEHARRWRQRNSTPARLEVMRTWYETQIASQEGTQ